MEPTPITSQLTYTSILRFSWEALLANKKYFGVIMLLIVFANVVGELIPAFLSKILHPAVGIMAGLTFFALQNILIMGLTKMAIKVSVQVPPSYDDIYDAWPLLLTYLIATFVLGIITVAGLLLFVVPGIYLIVRCGFCFYFVIDQNMGPLESIKASFRHTEGMALYVFLFYLLLLLINIGGALLCGVGLLITIPLSSIATACLFRNLVLRGPQTPF